MEANRPGGHMNRIFRRVVDNRDQASLAARFRRKRLELLNSMIASYQEPVTILDVGGEQRFWEMVSDVIQKDFRIVILNIHPPEITLPNFYGVACDATGRLCFSDNEFNIVFSNSVIEHLESFENQQQMASEIQRVGLSYMVQTPNKHFPLEPHFLMPFFQFFPFGLQVALTQAFDLGWYKRIPDREAARRHVRSHRLLAEEEFRSLFPDGQIYQEKVFGLTKSFVAFGVCR
jgi:hypothetical protein